MGLRKLKKMRNEFISYLKTYFGKNYENLHWGFLEEDDFVLGPNMTGQIQMP